MTTASRQNPSGRTPKSESGAMTTKGRYSIAMDRACKTSELNLRILAHNIYESMVAHAGVGGPESYRDYIIEEAIWPHIERLFNKPA